MSSKKYHVAAPFIFVFILSAAISAQTVTAQLDDLFRSPQSPVNGNVLIAENDRIIYERSFGSADAGAKVANGKDSRFDLASITKVFTSTAILQLNDAGKLNLDDPLIKHLPDFPYPEITIRHLLSHTSGLPDFQIFEDWSKREPDKVFKNTDVITALRSWKKPLAGKPGELWSYSNPGYCLLAVLIEKLSRSSYEDHIRTHIFDPAQMNSSYFEGEDAEKQDKNRAQNQRLPFLFSDELQRVAGRPKWNGLLGNGGIVSTAGDLLRFDQILYSGKLVSQATLEEAFTPMKLNDGSAAITDGLDGAFYGLGWFIFRNGSDGKIVWHGGGRPGVVDIFIRNITKKQTVIVLDNSFNRTVYRKGMNAINILNKRTVVIPKTSLVRDYARTLVTKGTDAAFARLVELKADEKNFYLDEEEMNGLAYQLLYQAKFERHVDLALEVAKLNTVFFPQSFNVYDTYGEILAKSGQKEAAIVLYRRSLALNPKNEEGRKALEELLK